MTGPGTSPHRAIFWTWPVRATTLAGDGAGSPLHGARGAPDRVRERRRGPAPALRRSLGVAPRGGLGRPCGARLLRGSRPFPPGRPVRPARGRALRPRARAPPDRGERGRAARHRARRVHGRAGDVVRVLVRRSRHRPARDRDARACPEDRLLRRLRVPRRHPRGDAPLARRLRARELVAGHADALRPLHPARRRRGDRGAQPLPAPRGGRRRRRGVPRARSLLERARPTCPR